MAADERRRRSSSVLETKERGCNLLRDELQKAQQVRLGPHPGPKTIKKNTNSTPNKSQTQLARGYEVTSFLSTDCEMSTDTCSKTFIVPGPGPCPGLISFLPVQAPAPWMRLASGRRNADIIT